MHVHLREPGATDKEDFEYGTRAAIAGGVTGVADMVNNPGHETNRPERLLEKIDLANGRISSDLAFHYRYQPVDNNESTFEQAITLAFGLKSMLDISTGNDAQIEPAQFRHGWSEWARVASRTQPIILHAETETISEGLAIAAGEIGHPTHVAHVSNRTELQAVIDAKQKGWPVTAGVTPHHLFMEDSYVRDWRQRMKPPLATFVDVEFLWRNMEYIDVFETDHAPHTLEEKQHANEQNPTGDEKHPVKSYGVPGLEAMVPLLFSALAEQDNLFPHGRGFEGISPALLVDKLAIRPRQILGIPLDPTSVTRVQITQPYEFDNVHSKCGWSPYEGWMMQAKVISVALHGQTVYQRGNFANKAPQGRVILPETS